MDIDGKVGFAALKNVGPRSHYQRSQKLPPFRRLGMYFAKVGASHAVLESYSGSFSQRNCCLHTKRVCCGRAMVTFPTCAGRLVSVYEGWKTTV